ncbi:MAG: RNA methyltransferase [Planctomycetes bacterium]|nr:RNA methyltransferase [Planctomycetota bacterium]
MATPIRIQSSQNAIVKSTIKLQRMSDCQKRGEFLVEGTHALTEAIITGWDLSAVFMTEPWLVANAHSLDLQSKSTAQYVVTPEILGKIATTTTPDGVVAIGRFGTKVRSEVPDFDVALALECVQDPGNVGTLLRTATATGAGPVFLSSDSVSAYHPKVLRATVGQWFRNPPFSIEIDDLLSLARSRKIQIAVADASGQSFWDCDFTKPTLFVLGNEGEGISDKARSHADSVVAIPMSLGVESLNVATTGSLLLYETLRQRRKQS